MKKVRLLILLSVSMVTLQGCGTPVSQVAETENSSVAVVNQTEILPPKNETQTFSNGKVDYKGVSFDYNPQIFSKVEAKEIAEHPLEYETDIPDYVAPQYLLFTIRMQNQSDIIIAVYPIDEYRRVWMPVEKNSTANFDKSLSQLKKFIANNKFRAEGEIPALPYNWGGQTFEAKVKNILFRNGKGVSFLTQRVQEKAIVNNGHLEYDFEGISKDGKYYVLAQSSVKVSFLPDDYHVGKFEDYTIPSSGNWSRSEQKTYDRYVAKITKRLENLPADQYKPNLSEFEKIISSLKIEK